MDVLIKIIFCIKASMDLALYIQQNLPSLQIIDIMGKDLDNEITHWGISWFIKSFWYIGPHNILDKLLYFGIKGTELAWF